jgi:alpha-ketoglutarate-dependent taurine dioxygenase
MSKLPSTFGKILHVSIDELLDPTRKEEWIDTMYKSKVLVLKGLLNLTATQLWDIHKVFGTPWEQGEYWKSFEKAQETEPGSGKFVTEYSNVLTKERIGDKNLPWHHDIPWHRARRYPIRSLYPTLLEGGAGEVTTNFCDCDTIWSKIPKDEWNKLAEADIRLQFWYDASKGVVNPATKVVPLVERHPYTKRYSLLLNSFGPTKQKTVIQELEHSTTSTGAWAIDCWSRNQHLGLEYLNSLHRLVVTEDNTYSHVWELGDLVLFDNYSGVFHGRDKIATEGTKRAFWRMNIKHSWQSTTTTELED